MTEILTPTAHAEQRLSAGSTITIQVSECEPDSRLDQFITSQIPSYSRSFFKRLIDDQLVTLNNRQVTKASATIRPGDTITITVPEIQEITQEHIEQKGLGVEILHKDEHFLIINKPAGLTVHKPHAQSTEVTLVDWLLLHHQDIAHVGAIDRPGIVHRLDKNTSGLLVVPRTNHAHTLFTDLFAQRALSKTYLALVEGHPEKKGTIDFVIGRHPTVKVKMIALRPNDRRIHTIANVREAITHYEVVSYFDNYSLVKIKLVTGRTHQIRVHFSAIGHPLLGDEVYGKMSKLIGRHALHAHELAFSLEGKPFKFTQPLPEDMQKLI